MRRLLSLSLLAPSIAIAQPSYAPGYGVSKDNPLPVAQRCADNGTWVSCDAQTRPVADANNAAFLGAEAVAVGATVTARRTLLANCTAAGNAVLRFVDASSLTVPLIAGLTMLPFAIVRVETSGTTATCTFANLK